jgi:hypothetical protein
MVTLDKVLNKGLQLQRGPQHNSSKTATVQQLRPYLNIILCNIKDSDPTETITATAI